VFFREARATAPHFLSGIAAQITQRLDTQPHAGKKRVSLRYSVPSV